MASTFDVAGRLAEGDRALTALDDYVAACQVLGMPASASLLELYRAESGLDLAALAADVRSLEAAGVVAQDALRLQGNGYRELAAQWSGRGGDAAADFLRTLTVAAEDVVAHLQRSVQALTTLRDELWRAVDTKVDAVLRADAQASGHRDEWCAAARAVLGGVGDVATASEIVDQQVKPFVLRVVSGDLLPALRDASEAVAAGYDSAIAVVTPASVSFAVPVVVTPEWVPPPSAQPTAAPTYHAAATPFGTLGTAASLAPPAPPATSVGAPAAPEQALGMAGVPEQALGAAAATPAGAGMPGDLGLGSGVGGLGQQLADAVGGALGSMAGLGPDSSGFGALDEIKGGLGDDLGLDDDADTAEDDDEDPDEDEEKKEADEEDETGEADEGASKVAAETDEQAAEPPPSDPVQPPPASTLPPPPVSPPVEPVAQQEDPTTKTPCQIAADQLPLAGD